MSNTWLLYDYVGDDNSVMNILGYFRGEPHQIIHYAEENNLRKGYCYYLKPITLIDVDEVDSGYHIKNINRWSGKVDFITYEEYNKEQIARNALSKLSPEEIEALNLTNRIKDY